MGDFWHGFFFVTGGATAMLVILAGLAAIILVGAVGIGVMQGLRDERRHKRNAGRPVERSLARPIIFPPPGAPRDKFK